MFMVFRFGGVAFLEAVTLASPRRSVATGPTETASHVTLDDRDIKGTLHP